MSTRETKVECDEVVNWDKNPLLHTKVENSRHLYHTLFVPDLEKISDLTFTMKSGNKRMNVVLFTRALQFPIKRVELANSLLHLPYVLKDFY